MIQIQELQEIGLTKNEAKVYSVLIGIGSTTAGEVIKKTKLHRNIVYDNLEKLIEKGLIDYVTIKGIKHFEVSSPSELKDFIQKQKQEILRKESLVKELLPRIENEISIERKQDASIFKGKRALKNVLEGITQSKTEILVFGTGWGMKETLKDYYEQWHLKLRQHKIKARILLPKTKKESYLKPFIAKYLLEKDVLPSTICIYENKVLTVLWGEEPLAILIYSEKVSDSYRNYFEVLWKIGK